MINESKRQVTIEDLLRLKRAERPSQEFWTEFDRELRAKQLAALVEKQPWWRTFPRTLRALARYHLPIGATAVLAVTLLSIRDFQPVLPNPAVGLSEADLNKPEEIPTIELPAVSVQPEQVDVETRMSSSSAPSMTSLTSSSNSAGQLARMVPTISAENGVFDANEIRPSARSIAVNRAAAEAMLGTGSTGFETRAIPVRSAPQEPLAQMSNPAETRRSRFAVAIAAAAVGTSPAPTARVARRLSDEQLYDSIHRFGASGNSVSFKF